MIYQTKADIAVPQNTCSQIRWFGVSLFVGCLLLFAACLKTHQIIAELPLNSIFAAWFSLFTIGIEIIFSFWLFLGVLPRAARLASIVLFSIFTAVSFYKTIAGEESCGCFGQITVNPLFTTILDAVVLIALGLTRPNPNIHFSMNRNLLLQFVGFVLLLFGTIALLSSATGVNLYRSFAADNIQTINVDGWVDQPFPFLTNIEAEELLNKGMWLLLLFDYHCSACRESIDTYTKLAADFSGKPGCPKVAAIEVPPFDSALQVKRKSPAVFGKLNIPPKMKVDTPVAFLLDNGIVKHVFTKPNDTAMIRAIWGGQK